MTVEWVVVVVVGSGVDKGCQVCGIAGAVWLPWGGGRDVA